MQIGFWNRHGLAAMVFITGGCVLVIEVVATRLLSPYFGTTIFTVTSVIGVVLAALSAGYYLGGKLADKHPHDYFLFAIILLSGLAVLGLQLLAKFFLPVGAYLFTMISGPPVFSVLLFFVPAFLLGMVSPYAVALQHVRQPERGVGGIAGNVFFWGTAGSIIGTFLTGFYLIPHFGLKAIVTGVALLLIGLGLLGSGRELARRRRVGRLLEIVLLVGLPLWLLEQPVKMPGVIYMKDGVYDRITITDRMLAGKRVRMLWQDATAESAIYLPDGETAFEFNKYFELYKLVRPDLNKALVIGGGAMTVPRMLLQNDPGVVVEVAEIEPALFDLAKRYFQVPFGERLQPVIEDGRRYLYQSPGGYDLIYLDAYRGWHVPPHLTTVEFLQLAREKTSANGVLVANLIGSTEWQETTYAGRQMETWRQVWPNSYFFAADDPNSSRVQNLAAVGFKTDEPIDLSRVQNLMPGSLLTSLPAKVIERPDNRPAIPALTDDFAPVEWLLARDLQRFGASQE